MIDKFGEFSEDFILDFQAIRKYGRLKERVIFCYLRFGVSRNLSEIALDALQEWQLRQPGVASNWSICLAGEGVDATLIRLANATVAGKMSLDDYSRLLERTSVAVSLMQSPHPSYPPLEMSSRGAVVITNAYANKDLSTISMNIQCIGPIVDASSLADAIEGAVARAEFTIVGRPAPEIDIMPNAVSHDEVAKQIASLIALGTEKRRAH